MSQLSAAFAAHVSGTSRSLSAPTNPAEEVEALPDIDEGSGEAEGSTGVDVVVSFDSPSSPTSLQREQRGIRRSKMSSLIASAGT